MKRLLFILCGIIVSCFFSPSAASALILSPSIIEAEAGPSGVVSSFVELKNDSPVLKTFYPTIQKFVPRGENGQQNFLPLTDVSGLPSWIYVLPSSVKVAPGAIVRVPFEIRVPTYAEPGGYYAALFWSDQAPDDRSDGQSSIASRIGTLLFFMVNGSVDRTVRLERFSAASVFSSYRLPVRFSLRLQNQGNVHVAPVGFVKVTNLFGKTVARLSINPDAMRLLPHQDRTLSVDWSPASKRSVFGWYRAELEKTTVLSGSATTTMRFFILPSTSILSSFSLVFVLFMVGLIRVFRHTRRKTIFGSR